MFKKISDVFKEVCMLVLALVTLGAHAAGYYVAKATPTVKNYMKAKSSQLKEDTISLWYLSLGYIKAVCSAALIRAKALNSWLSSRMSSIMGFVVVAYAIFLGMYYLIPGFKEAYSGIKLLFVVMNIIVASIGLLSFVHSKVVGVKAYILEGVILFILAIVTIGAVIYVPMAKWLLGLDEGFSSFMTLIGLYSFLVVHIKRRTNNASSA